MRFYRWLLGLCPSSLRREYGAAMEETFSRRLADAVQWVGGGTCRSGDAR